MKTKNLRENVMLLAPLFGLVALLVAFFIIGTSKNINVAYADACKQKNRLHQIRIRQTVNHYKEKNRWAEVKFIYQG